MIDYNLYLYKGNKYLPSSKFIVRCHNITDGLKINKKEKLSLLNFLIRLYFLIITRGNTLIYYVEDRNKIVHSSYVVGKCYKFPFLGDGDVEIGPCFTMETYRGMGIYPEVLYTIVSTLNAQNYYMVVHESNESSIRGVLKIGFEKIGNIQKSKLLKRYRRQ